MLLQILRSGVLLGEHAKFSMPMDPTLVGYMGMKGLVDLRVADILAKQAAMHHESFANQARAAMQQADISAAYTSILPQTSGEPSNISTPHSSGWYDSKGFSSLSLGKYLPAVGVRPKLIFPSISDERCLILLTLPGRRKIPDFL